MSTGEPTSIAMAPAQINVPNSRSLYVSASVMSDGNATDEAVQTAAQEIIDLLQGWAGRSADITAQFYVSSVAMMTPSDPDPLPDPPEPDPNG